jgi:antitoxin (DNA-binding transcriptional repressor) of toxin-antitoxin stability system
MTVKINLGNARIVSMRELNQRTSAVIDEINQSNEQAVITKHGRFVALITPLGNERVESVVLSGDRVGELLRAQNQLEEAGEARGMPLDHAEAWLRDE